MLFPVYCRPGVYQFIVIIIKNVALTYPSPSAMPGYCSTDDVKKANKGKKNKK